MTQVSGVVEKISSLGDVAVRRCGGCVGSFLWCKETDDECFVMALYELFLTSSFMTNIALKLLSLENRDTPNMTAKVAATTAATARPTDDGSRNDEEAVTQLFVEASPRIQDPRELHTILNFSLRDLWGLCEPYSCRDLQVRRYRPEDDKDNNNTDDMIATDNGNKRISKNKSSGDKNHLLVIQCPTASVARIQAALTFVSPPPYLDDTTYRLDVVEIRRVQV